jgi:hypothetical protein
MMIKVENVPPLMPIIFSLSHQDAVIKIEADPNIYAESETTIIGKGLATENGEFEVTIPRQRAGMKLVVYAEDSLVF